MAKIKLNGDSSGYIEISAPAVSYNNTLELGPGTRILTNLDNTFTGITTFSNGIHITSGGFILNQQRSDTHASLIIDKPDAGTGTLKFFNNGSASAYIQHTNSEHLNYYLPSGSGSQVFYTNGTERLRVTSSGKVGINTASPRAVLDVEGNAENAILMLHSNDANANLQFSDNTGGARILNYGGDLAFRTGTNAHVFGTGDSEAIRITSDNKLGINITNPTRQLEIYNSSHATAALQSDTQSSLFFSDPSDTNIGQISYMHSSNYMYFRVNDAERLRITSDGKVGIGIDNPARGGLHIHKAATAELHLTDDTTGSGSGDGFTLFSTSSSAGVWYRENAPLRFATNNTERLRIGSDGHLSYLNTSPPAWQVNTGYANMTFGSSAYLRTDTDVNSNFLSIGCNAYRGSSTWQHVNSGYATQLQMSANDGNLTYNTSTINGSAGNSITWNEVIRITRSEVGIGGVPGAGDGATYNNWDVPKLHVRGGSGSGKFHLLGRFRAGSDADNTGAQIVIHHENDRGMALQGGRSVSNRSYGAIKSLDNLAREATVMDFRGDAGQGVDYIKFYTGTSNSTTEQFKIDSSGRISKPNQPRFFAYASTTLTKSTGWHTYSWDHTRFNVGNHFSTSTNLFTVPVDGCYLFGAQVRYDNGGSGYFRLIISINASTDDNNQAHSIQDSNGSTGDSYFSQAVTGLYELNANDNVRVYVFSNSDTSWQPHSESQFWGYLVA